MRKLKDPLVRFNSRVKIAQPPSHRPELGPCHEWTGAKVYGYGCFSIRKISLRAHRWIFFQNNPDSDQSLNVLHQCDNRACVNVKHLKLGTQQENIDDCIAKKRFRVARGKDSGAARHPEVHQGELHGMAKLDNQKIHHIRKLVKQGWKDIEIAAMFSVCRESIGSIRRGKTWKHVPQQP